MSLNSTTAAASSTTVSRRTIARGALWATPVITVASAAPVLAASPVPGLNGWVDVGKNCPLVGARTVRIDGNGDGSRYPAGRGYGIYVVDLYQDTAVSDASITFYYPSSMTITWSANTGTSGWSVPAIDTSEPVTGYTGYKTSYSGGWTYHAASGAQKAYKIAAGVPNFTGTYTVTRGSDTLCGNNEMTVYARRTVTVGGTVYSFLRGPVYL